MNSIMFRPAPVSSPKDKVVDIMTPTAENGYHHTFVTSQADVWGNHVQSGIPSRRPDLNNLIHGISKKDGENGNDEANILTKPSLTDLEPAVRNVSPVRKSPPGLARDSEIFSDKHPASPTSLVSERLKSLLDEAESPVPRRIPDWDMASPTSPCGSPQVFGTHPDSHYWQSYYQAAVSNFEQARENLNQAEQAMRLVNVNHDNNWNTGYASPYIAQYYNPFATGLESGRSLLRPSSLSEVGTDLDKSQQIRFQSMPSFSELPVQYVNDNNYNKDSINGLNAAVPQKLSITVNEEGKNDLPELEEWSPKIKPPEGLRTVQNPNSILSGLSTPSGSISARSGASTDAPPSKKKGKGKNAVVNRISGESGKVDISLSELVEAPKNMDQLLYRKIGDYYVRDSAVVVPQTPTSKAIAADKKAVTKDTNRSTTSKKTESTKNSSHAEPTVQPARQTSQKKSDPIRAPTTMMLRNIPNKYTRDMLLDEIRNEGFENQYDFVYLPIDFRHRCNVGYAFVNFINPEIAAEFKKVFDGFKLTAVKSAKVCGVSEAKVQGQQENADQYRNSAVTSMAEKFHPLFFKDGNRIPFPPPLDADGIKQPIGSIKELRESQTSIDLHRLYTNNPIIAEKPAKEKSGKKKDKKEKKENDDDKNGKRSSDKNRSRGGRNNNKNDKKNGDDIKNAV